MKKAQPRDRSRDALSLEVGYVRKPHAGRLRVALAFPNTYYVGMSSLGYQTVYRLFNALDDVVCERVFLLRGQEHGQAAGAGMAERIRDGFEVAILGPPNIGKSTLLNALAGRDAAITSDVAGTTRDVIEVRMDLDGLPVTFLDTAGLRATDDRVESIGIDRAIARAREADLRVVLIEDQLPNQIALEQDDLVLIGKSDHGGPGGISGLTGQGVSLLLQSISKILAQRASSAGVAIQERHRIAIVETDAILGHVLADIKCGHSDVEIVSEELRTAVTTLDALVGKIGVENILDEIFSSFCLGK